MTAKHATKAGTSPGTLAHVGTRWLNETRIRVLSYNENDLDEKDRMPIDACRPFLNNSDVSWISVAFPAFQQKVKSSSKPG